jgi:hypothetical protein
MGTEVFAGGIGEFRTASTAAGGTALTTTATFIAIPDGTRHIFLTPRNFSTAVVAKVAFNPYLYVLKTTDAGVTYTDYSKYAQDGDASTDVTLSSLSTAANGDYLLIGAELPFRGVYVDVDDSHVNGTASALTVYYYNGTTWADASATDGSDSGGTSMAQDGLVYWTINTAWVTCRLIDVYTSITKSSVTTKQMYWTKWAFAAGLDSDTLIDGMYAANRDTSHYGELLEGQPFELAFHKGEGYLGCVEALTNAGTGNLVVNVAAVNNDGRLF